MVIDERLLAALSDGQFHSGQELGQHLGISRSAIWKQMKNLESLGVEIYSIRGRGYRVPGGLELLCEERIVSDCSDLVARHLRNITVQRVVDSTNTLAMRDMQQGLADAHLYLAEYQTAGKGRRGRQWVSPFARNLYFSLVWNFSHGAAALEGLSLVVGLALQQALTAMGLSGIELKWPNDLLVDSKKLAGILLEMQGDASGECQVVIGVGINVTMSDEASEGIDQPWVDLTSLSQTPISRNQLMATVLNHLIPMLEQFKVDGFAAFQDAWHACHAYQQQPVRIISGHREVVGECQGVDAQGALVIHHSDGVEHFHAGEVSVRAYHAS
jgi:BirA family biotin operon repressor/biotin-[acetyl-CoA-carboxylase] ligase